MKLKETCLNRVRRLEIFRVIRQNQINAKRLWKIFPRIQLVDQASNPMPSAKILQSCMFHVYVKIT